MDMAKKYCCENCGSSMEFDALSQKLKCLSCGYEIEIKHEEDKVIEHELTQHILDNIKVEEKHSSSMECEGCGAIVEVDAASVATTCGYCGANYVLASKQMDVIIPDGVISFKIDKEQAHESYRKWIKGRWLAPKELKSLYQIDKIQGIYIPYWTFDARVDASYKAMGGKDYTVVKEDKNGNKHTETRTNWYHTSGSISYFFDDMLIKASNKLNPNLSNLLDYDTKDVLSYSPDYMSGHCMEIYSVDLKEAHIEVKKNMKQTIRRLCERKVLRAYDKVNNLVITNMFYSDETYKYILAPVYSSAYSYKSKEFNILINGQSGEVHGEYPKSIFKISLIATAIISVVGYIAYQFIL